MVVATRLNGIIILFYFYMKYSRRKVNGDGTCRDHYYNIHTAAAQSRLVGFVCCCHYGALTHNNYLIATCV